jgi:hypothetical protein
MAALSAALLSSFSEPRALVRGENWLQTTAYLADTTPARRKSSMTNGLPMTTKTFGYIATASKSLDVMVCASTTTGVWTQTLALERNGAMNRFRLRPKEPEADSFLQQKTMWPYPSKRLMRADAKEMSSSSTRKDFLASKRV